MMGVAISLTPIIPGIANLFSTYLMVLDVVKVRMKYNNATNIR